MIIRKKAKSTLTALEMNHGETLEFTLLDGSVTRLLLESTGAEIVRTTLREPGVTEPGATTVYRFWSRIRVNGRAIELEREVGTQRSFYEPWVVDGVRIWLDAVDAIFTFMRETHAPCQLAENASLRLPPRRQARFAVQDATARICPERLALWCPLPEGRLRIEDCYRGEDCWLGAYDGASAHGGLDINHPRGTPLRAPLDMHDHFCFNSLATGHNNNRWRGLHRWPDGSEWILQAHHIVELTVPEHEPIPKGAEYAKAAGVFVGRHDHSHFVFKIYDAGELVLLDPWILFWQMLQDAEER